RPSLPARPGGVLRQAQAEAGAMTRRLVALASFVLAAPAIAAVAPRLDVTLAPATVTVGDPITVTATLELPESGLPVTIEPSEASPGDLRALDEPRLVREPDGTGERLTWTWRVALFRPGRFELPAPAVEIGGDPPR